MKTMPGPNECASDTRTTDDRTAPMARDTITARQPEPPAKRRTLLHYDESTPISNKAPKVPLSERLRRTFDIADNGWVRTSQLERCFGGVQARRFLRLADSDGNGRIDYELFLTRMLGAVND